MAEGLPMEETASSSPKPHKPTESLSCPPCSPTNNTTDIATDNSSHSVNDLGPSTPTHEHLPEDMLDTTAIKPLRPYAIEEPDDEPEPLVPRRLGLPCLPDCFERWQRELVESIDDMEDKAATSPSASGKPIPKRGLKRKPIIGAVGSGYSQPGSQKAKSKAKLDDDTLPTCGFNAKRRRRRSKALDDTTSNSASVSLQEFRDTRADESSTSELQSSSSSLDASNESALADEMDID